MKKTIGSTDEYYMYTGGRLTGVSGNGKEMYFSYDSIGNPVAVMYNGNEYYYVKNIQSDIIGLVDGSGTWVVEYSYDAWGRVLSVTGTMAMTLGQDNPLRYRGYFYDVETGFYYVSSRYYDPGVGRFISADGEIFGVGGDITGYNLYSYCGNNPVNRIDPDGHAWKDVKNWFSNTWNKVKKTAKKIVTTVKKKAYSVYYKATKWHFEDRAKKNGAHPSYSAVNKKISGWNLLHKSQSVYHDNGIGKSELKYITDDGREAVFDGDTLAPVTDPRYIATYNYSPLYQMPSSGAGVSDYAKLAGSGIGHFFADMLPYYLTGNSNTREQFESKIFIFD